MSETDDIVERLRAWDKAYPEDMFPPVNDLEAIQLRNTHPGIIDRLFAMMGRHLAKFAKEAAAHITRLEERCAALEGQVEAGAAEIERLKLRVQSIAETNFNGVLRSARARVEAAKRKVGEALASKQWAEARLDAAAGEAAALKEEVGRMREALEKADRVLVQTFGRIHALPRTSDTDLANLIGQIRVEISTVLKPRKP